jgi:hypothetical protein
VTESLCPDCGSPRPDWTKVCPPAARLRRPSTAKAARPRRRARGRPGALHHAAVHRAARSRSWPGLHHRDAAGRGGDGCWSSTAPPPW